MPPTNQLEQKDIVQLLAINDLIYSRTQESNPVIERNQKRSFAEGGGSSTFTPGDHLIINFQSGNDFIDPLQSFLVFDVKVDANVAYVPGSILNLFSASQIESRGGKEIDRTRFLNLFNYHRLKGLEPDLQSHNLKAMVMFTDNHEEGKLQAAPLDRKQLTTTNKRVMVPLKYLSGVFDNNKLMPPHLARGLKVDLTLEAYATALAALTGGDPGGYTISKPYILTDNYRMADSVLSFLNKEFASKKNGLVYEFYNIHTTTTSLATQALNVEVRKSVSLAIDAFCVTRLAADNVIGRDSFASAVSHDDDISQWMIGSLFLPSKPSTGTIEHYTQMLYYKNKLRMDKACGTSYHEFRGGLPSVNDLNYGQAIFPVTLQRNNILDLSGIAINNSQTLSIDATLGTASVSKTVQIFMRSVRRAVLFLENLTLET